MFKPDIKKNVKLLYWYNFFSWFLFAYPVLILFFNEVLDNYTLSMSLFAIQTIACSFFEIPSGMLSDKLGRKKIMIISSIFWLLSFIFYASANGYLMLVVGSILYGLGNAFSSGNDDALLFDTLRDIKAEKKYHKIYSKIFSYSQFGLALASLIGGVIAFYSLRFAVVLSIIPFVIIVIISFMVKEPKVVRQNNFNYKKHFILSLRNLWRNKRLRYISLANSLHYGLNEAAFDFNSIFIKQFVPIWSLGVFRAMGHSINSLGAVFSCYFSKRIGLEKVAVYGYFGDNIANILSVLSANVLTPFIRLFAPLFGGIGNPAANVIMQEEIKNKQRATTLSNISILGSIFYSVFAIFVGALADIFSPYWAMLAAYTLALLSNFFAYISIKFPSKSFKEELNVGAEKVV